MSEQYAWNELQRTRDLLKIAGEVGADAIEAYEMLDEKLRAALVILQRHASREELITLDIEGALVAANCIRMGGRSRPESSSNKGADRG